MAPNTKAMIADAFLELSKRQSVDKITVKNLVDACHISRQTFYYHFQDILDVIEWSAKQSFQELLTHAQDYASPEDALRALVEASSDKGKLLQKLLHSQRWEQIEGILVQTTRAYLGELLSRQPSQQTLSLAEAQILLDFCTYGIVGLLIDYSGKPAADRENLIRQMSRMIEQLENRKEG